MMKKLFLLLMLLCFFSSVTPADADYAPAVLYPDVPVTHHVCYGINYATGNEFVFLFPKSTYDASVSLDGRGTAGVVAFRSLPGLYSQGDQADNFWYDYVDGSWVVNTNHMAPLDAKLALPSQLTCSADIYASYSSVPSGFYGMSRRYGYLEVVMAANYAPSSHTFIESIRPPKAEGLDIFARSSSIPGAKYSYFFNTQDDCR